MKKLSYAIIVISLFLMLGIVGGVETGGNTLNLLWCVPLSAAALISSKFIG